MEECLLVHLLKYSIKTIPNNSGITDLLDLLVDIEDQPVFLHSTQIILIYTELLPVCIYVFNYLIIELSHCNFKSVTQFR